MVLSLYDLQLADPGAHMPPVDVSRYGYGMLHPDGDLSVRYKYKKNV